MNFKTAAASAAFALAIGMGAPNLALADEQYVDSTGFAISGYDVVAYFDKAQADVGGDQLQATPGKASITAEYNGAVWAFSTEENRDRFVADPAAFAPAYGGHCAYGVAQGGIVPGNPHLWRIVDGTLYLNITRPVVGLWEEDVPGFIATANTNWDGGLDEAEASEMEIPQYSEWEGLVAPTEG